MGSENIAEDEKVRIKNMIENNQNKDGITSRKYKITVCIIAILLAAAFGVKDYIIYTDSAYGRLGATGIDEFVRWWLVVRKSYLIAGLIIILIPYEHIYNGAHLFCAILDPESRRTRNVIIALTFGVMMFMTYVAVTTGYFENEKLFILCNAAIGVVICLSLKQFFETPICWLLYASIYNTGSLGLMLYLIHRKGDVALNASNPFDWMSIGQIDVFLIIVCVSTAIIFTVYAMMREDKDRTVWAFIAFILITLVVPVVIVYKPIHSTLKSVNGNIDNLIGQSSVEKTGISAYSNPKLIALYLIFVFVMILLAYAAKKVYEYSVHRMVVLVWTAIVMLIILATDTVNHMGMGYTCLYSISDVTNAALLFVAVRALIIPVKTKSEFECKFLDPDVEIIDLRYDEKITDVSIKSLRDQVSALVKMTSSLELKLKLADAEIECLKGETKKDDPNYQDRIDDINCALSYIGENGDPTDREQLFDKIKQLKTMEDEQIEQINADRYKRVNGIFDDACDEIDEKEKNSDSDEKTYEEEIRANYRRLTQLLISRNLTITTMESATSGQVASLITDTEGSSAVLKGAFVTYCNEAKIMQGVPAEIIDKYTVYSKETAGAMAKACRKAYNANIGIGVTGTMGNVDPANPDASVPGQVYFAIDTDGNVKAYYVELPPQPSRLAYKLAVAEEIYEELVKRLE